MVAVLLVSTLHSAVVHAQSATQLSVQPSSVNIATGSTTSVIVEVSGGSDLNAFDLTIVYDAEVIVLEAWSHGTYLSNLAVVFQENQPGLFHIAATQLATPGVTGDGTLLNLVFRGVAQGSSEVELQKAEMATSSSKMVIPAVNDGVITVITSVLPTTTATNTPLPTATTSPAAATLSDAPAILTATAVLNHTGTPTAAKTVVLPGGMAAAASTLQPTSQPAANALPGLDISASSAPGDKATASSSTDPISPGKPAFGNLELFNSLLWTLVTLLLIALVVMLILRIARKK